MPAKLTQIEFETLLKNRNTQYPPVLCLCSYKGRHTKITFKCQQEHQFIATPNNVLNGFGCSSCSGKKQKTHKQFLTQLATLNATRREKVYVCKNERYKSSFVPLQFTCLNKHTWSATPSNIINSKRTCQRCARKNKKTPLEFLQELQLKRPHVCLIEGQHYKTAHTKLQFMCEHGHKWGSRPIDVLIGYGCPFCVRKGYSQKCIAWLARLSNEQDIHIQHAENGGEYLIPNTRYYADGYCADTKTVYEFYGDAYHGNPKMFEQNETCHPYNKETTAGKLFYKTIEREMRIKKLGYSVVSIWETEFNELTKTNN